MRVILVVERKHLFPGLSPQGFLAPGSVNLSELDQHLFFGERDFMENNSHFKQIIPYLLLTRGQDADARVLSYQRRTKHTERRLGGMWSVGFGGHIEPLDRDEATADNGGLLKVAALREMEEETGLKPGVNSMEAIGFINSDSEDVSSVHFGVVYQVNLDNLPGDDQELIDLVSEQAEPHQARWIKVSDLKAMTSPDAGPDGGSFENWSAIAIEGAL